MFLNKLFQMAIQFFPLIAGCYVLIIAAQRKHSRQINLINQSLCPGATVKTVSHLQGTIIFTTHNTVIMQLTNGQKIEVLKQTITSCSHEKVS